jgi:hypothetical protein
VRPLRRGRRGQPDGRALNGSDVGGVIELLSRPEFEMTLGERIRIDGGVYL